MPEINLAPGIDPSHFSQHSREVLEHLLTASGNPGCLITSLTRTPHQQAVAMRKNCIDHGVEVNYRLYTKHDGTRLPGCAVIDVFKADAAKGPEETVADMEAKILELGPEHVSHHCGDPTKLQVIDIALSSLTNHDALVQMALAHSGAEVSKCLDEPFNRCLHIEIPQPAVESVA